MDHLEAPSFFDLWNEFCHQEWYPAYARHFAAMAQPQERVIPAYRAIQDLAGVLPHEGVPLPLAQAVAEHRSFSIERARARLGYQPATSFPHDLADV